MAIKRSISSLLWVIAPLLILPFLAVWYEDHKRDAFLQNDPFYQLDSVAGHLHTADTSRYVEWPEHAASGFEMATNNRGFREDANTPETTSALRMMVLGDSHTDGVCANSESFANVAETIFNEKFAGTPIEVDMVNAGTGFYSFQHYLGSYRKHRALANDWIVTVYLGNDFIETLLYDERSVQIGPTLETSWYRVRKKMLNAGTGMASTQAVNQLLFFHLYPEKKQQALALAKQHLDVMIDSCAAGNEALTVLLLPPKMDVDTNAYKALAEATGWPATTLNINHAFGDSLMTYLRQRDVQVLHLGSTLRNAGQPVFWEADHHLNVVGHAAVAKAITDWF